MSIPSTGFMALVVNASRTSTGRQARVGRRSRARKPAFPDAAEAEYKVILEKAITEITEGAVNTLYVTAETYGGKSFRDSAADDIEKASDMVDRTIEDSIKKYVQSLESVGSTVDYASQRAFSKTAEPFIRQKFNQYATNSKTIISDWQKNNLSLIKSASRESIKKIGTVVSDGVRDGTNWKQIQKEIRATSEGMSKSKAELIARDQIGDLNAALTKDRQESAGVSMYYWRGTNDGRERESHIEMEGVLCRWDDRDIYSEDDGKTWISRTGSMPHSHPGEDINCRCTAEGAVELELDRMLDDE